MLRTGEEFTGLRLVPEGVQRGGQFAVWAGEQDITRSSLEVWSPSELRLDTELLPSDIGMDVDKDLLLMIEDAEQSAAVALALAAGMAFPGCEDVPKAPMRAAG